MSAQQIPPVIHCKNHINAENRTRVENSVANRTAEVAANVYLAVKIKYVVIPVASDGNISIQAIRAQHDVLNAHYLSYQPTAAMPSGVVHYPFSAIWGNANIQFYPFNSADITETSVYLQRMKTPTSVPSNGYTDPSECQAEYQSQGGIIEKGVIYVYITSLESSSQGSLLGMAGNIIANYLMVSYGTIGSPSYPGAFQSDSSLSMFSFGKTLAHELGHCLGLYHNFSGSTDCHDSDTIFIQSQNPQSPLQINPNYGGLEFLENLTNGNYNYNGLDNRGRDLLRLQGNNAGLKPGDNSSSPAYSCASSTDLQIASTPFETFMMIMDYGKDVDRIGFPSATTATMRSVLVNHPELFSVTQLTSIPSGAVITPTPASDSALSTGAIVGIAIGGVVALLFILVLIWYAVRKSRGESLIPHKEAAAYVSISARKTFI